MNPPHANQEVNEFYVQLSNILQCQVNMPNDITPGHVPCLMHSLSPMVGTWWTFMPGDFKIKFLLSSQFDHGNA